MVPLFKREELKCVLTTPMVQYAMICGMRWMRKLHADNLDSVAVEQMLSVTLTITVALDPSTSIMCSVWVTRVI